MQSGLQALQNAIAEGKARGQGSGSSGGWLKWVSWKPGERKIVRFLTDDIQIGDFYQSLLTKDGKTTSFLVDPKKGDFPLRFGAKAKAWTGGAEEPKIKKMGVGVVVIRDEITGSDGRPEVVDHFEPLKFGDNEYDSRYFGIILQSLTNFWDEVAFLAKRNGTLVDRDYEIIREGERLDTKYRVLACNPVPGLSTEAEVQEHYGYGRPWPTRPADDEKDPVVISAWKDRFLYCPETLTEWADKFSSEDRARKLWLNEDGSPSVATSAPPVPESTVASTTTTPNFESLRDRLKPHMK